MTAVSGAADSAISKIHAFEKFGSILGLERMTILMDLLGNPQDDLRVIHVAGTNGKGSICRYLYCALQAAGYKTGLYISPFIEVFNERIEAGGEMISDEDLAKYTDRVLEQVKVMTDAGHQSPTEFEVITAVAFLYYKEVGCDFVVLEVGLGGRGDSTNIVRNPLATVIASISFDHTDRLGNTIEEIAAEKAGILKKGCPVITSCEDEAALGVIRSKAEELGCMYLETRDMPYTVKEESLTGYKFDVSVNPKSTECCCGSGCCTFENLEISMTGEHQIKNLKAALAALCVLEDRGIIKMPAEALYEGLKAAKQPGRLEVMKAGRIVTGNVEDGLTIIIDGAHNDDGARALTAAMERFCLNPETVPGGVPAKILMGTGILADKDVDAVLGHFARIAKDFVLTEPDNPRKMAAEDAARHMEAAGGQALIIESDIETAVKAAMEKAEAEGYDVLLFAGSLYLIGAVRGILRRALESQNR